MDKKSLLLIPAAILLYSFCTFSWSYGNALAEQTDYDNFRITIAEYDLANTFKTSTEKDDVYLQIVNSTGLSATMVQEFRAFPITRYTYFDVQAGANQYSNVGYIKMDYFYANKFYQPYSKAISTGNLKEDIKFYDCNMPGYTTLSSNYYEEIRKLPIKDDYSNKSVICLIFNENTKSPQLDTLEKDPFIYHIVEN